MVFPIGSGDSIPLAENDTLNDLFLSFLAQKQNENRHVSHCRFSQIFSSVNESIASSSTF